MIFFYVLLAGITFCKLKKRKEGEENFDRNNTTCLKGLCSILVVFHHLGQKFQFSGTLDHFNLYFAEISVGLFFLLSAYGLVIQYKKFGKQYLKKILLKNIPRLYLWMVCTNLLVFLIFDLQSGVGIFDFHWILRVLGLDWLNLENRYAWYVCTLLVMYVCFVVIYFCCDRLKNKNVAPILMSIVAVLFQIIILVIGIDRLILFSRSLQCFSVGILYATYKPKLDFFLQKWKGPILLVSFCVFIFGLRFDVGWINTVLICFDVIIFLQYFSIENPIPMFLGKISLGTYLLQIIFLNLFIFMVDRQFWYAFVVILCSVLAGAVATLPQMLFQKKIQKKQNF